MSRILQISYNMDDDSVIRERIKQMGPWMNYFDGSWFIDTDLSTKDVYNKLSTDYEETKFLIIEINIRSYWGRMPRDAWDWLEKHSDLG